jgi:hypothetical protein
MPFFQNILGTSRDFIKSAVKISKIFDPSPPKNFPSPLPSSQDFCPGSCMQLDGAGILPLMSNECKNCSHRAENITTKAS